MGLPDYQQHMPARTLLKGRTCSSGCAGSASRKAATASATRRIFEKGTTGSEIVGRMGTRVVDSRVHEMMGTHLHPEDVKNVQGCGG